MTEPETELAPVPVPSGVPLKLLAALVALVAGVAALVIAIELVRGALA